MLKPCTLYIVCFLIEYQYYCVECWLSSLAGKYWHMYVTKAAIRKHRFFLHRWKMTKNGSPCFGPKDLHIGCYHPCTAHIMPPPGSMHPAVVTSCGLRTMHINKKHHTIIIVRFCKSTLKTKKRHGDITNKYSLQKMGTDNCVVVTSFPTDHRLVKHCNYGCWPLPRAPPQKPMVIDIVRNQAFPLPFTAVALAFGLGGSLSRQARKGGVRWSKWFSLNSWFIDKSKKACIVQISLHCQLDSSQSCL